MPATSSNANAYIGQQDSWPQSRCRWPALAALVLSMAGCSGSVDSEATDDAVVSSNRLLAFDGQGFFRAGNVAGLEFVSGAQTGITDATGAYRCEEGRRIAFSLGSVALGDTDCASVAHAAALTASGSLAAPAALNMMRFLMVLDQDENPDNGIVISDSLRAMADSWGQIDFLASDFESELSQVVSDIASVEGRIVNVPDGATAFIFLDASLSCAYSGVFSNWFSGESGSFPISLSLRTFREPASNADVGELLMIRKDPLLPLYFESTGEVTLGNLPSVSQSDFSADFVTVDMLMGSWRNAVTMQAWDRTGSFEAFRLGGPAGEYRFVGKAEREDTLTPGRQLLSEFEVTLTGDTLSGRAFDLLLGASLPITGRRIAGSDDFEIELSEFGTATVTLVLDADGEPVGLTGGWPNFEGDVVEAVGCRLT